MLAIRALQRGIGSMEFVESLLLLEDEEDNETNIRSQAQGSKTSSEQTDASTSTGAGSSVNNDSGARPEWCKCGNCKPMPREIENKCCGSRICVTEQQRFSKLCLDAEVLQLCIMNRADICNDKEDNSTSSFRKAAYRQYILDRHGHLTKGKQKSCSCMCSFAC